MSNYSLYKYNEEGEKVYLTNAAFRNKYYSHLLALGGASVAAGVIIAFTLANDSTGIGIADDFLGISAAAKY